MAVLDDVCMVYGMIECDVCALTLNICFRAATRHLCFLNQLSVVSHESHERVRMVHDGLERVALKRCK